jgi:hypothetical protein
MSGFLLMRQVLWLPLPKPILVLQLLDRKYTMLMSLNASRAQVGL